MEDVTKLCGDQFILYLDSGFYGPKQTNPTS